MIYRVVCVTKPSRHKPASANIIIGIISWSLICALLSTNVEETLQEDFINKLSPFETAASIDGSSNRAPPLFMLMCDFPSTQR